MTAEGEGATKVGARAGRAWRALVAPTTAPIWIAVILVLALVISLFLFDGLKPAESAPAPAVAGTRLDTSLYAATVLTAELTDSVEDEFLEAEPGEDLLIVTLRLENLTSRPAGVGQSADGIQSRLTDGTDPLLTLVGVEPSDVRSWRTDGSAGGVILQPGVPAELQIVWTVPEDAFPGGTALIDVHDAREQAGQVILSASAVTWRRTELVARVAVEIKS